MKLFAQTEPLEDAPPPTPPAPGKPSVRVRDHVRRRPAWLFPALTLTLIAVGQEALFRCLFPFPEVAGFNRISYQMTAQGHTKLRAMLDRGLVYDRLLVESKPDGYSETHGLNIYGFRGQDFAIDPSPGKRRVLLIGDSVTEGMGAPDSATIACQLESLAARDGDRAEVINLGVIAATLNHTLTLARDAIPLLRPTDVVIILYANDLPAPPYETIFDQPGHRYQRSKELWWMPRTVALLLRYTRNEPLCIRWLNAPIRFFPPVPDLANPWSQPTQQPGRLKPSLHREMMAGTLNPWLKAQSDDLPVQLGHDFSKGGSPRRHLARIAEVCKSVGSRLTVAYVPFCGVVSQRYVPFLVDLGMDRTTAEALAVDPIYRRQNRVITQACISLQLTFVDATPDLVRAEAAGKPQYWDYDTHPRPAGYVTIALGIHLILRGQAQ
jgi:hypothetical protein